MSEYQYYEFQAIDRPLTAKEMEELRSYSTRARITPTSFVNDYAWGDFKGDEDAWMAKYFDAFLYLANWGTHVVKLRLPSRLLDSKTAKAYCGGDSTFAGEKSGKVILSFVSEDEEGGDRVEGEGHLSSLISVRAELARGDLRALYLGWLLRAQAGELDDEDPEPPVPAGLGQLTASLESLADFLRIDGDLLHVAAVSSPPLAGARIDRDEVRAWIGTLPTKEKDELIANLVVDADDAQIAELLQRFLKQRGDDGCATTGRTVGQLLQAAEAYAKQRKRIEAEKRAKQKARREREAAIARKKHPDHRPEAESLAVELVSSPSVENIVEDVITDMKRRMDLGRLQRRRRRTAAGISGDIRPQSVEFGRVSPEFDPEFEWTPSFPDVSTGTQEHPLDPRKRSSCIGYL